jgi:hypothetical protein
VNYRLTPYRPPEDLSHLNPKQSQRIAAGLARHARARSPEEQAAVEARNRAAGKATRGTRKLRHA